MTYNESRILKRKKKLDPKGRRLFCGSFLRNDEVLADVGEIKIKKDLKDLSAIQKEAGLLCGFFLRKGEVLA